MVRGAALIGGGGGEGGGEGNNKVIFNLTYDLYGLQEVLRVQQVKKKRI